MIKKLLSIFLVLMALASCSDKGYDAVEAQQLCSQFRLTHDLDHDQIDRLIDQESYALTDIRNQLTSLNEIADESKFDKTYSDLKADTAFVSMWEMSEMMWRVLVLSQGKFSESNLQRFKEVASQRRIVDMLHEEIVIRSYAPEKHSGI